MKLEIPNCSLDILCNLPSGLIYLDCNSNSIEIIQPSSLPESLEELNISSNSIRGTLKLILPNLTKLNCNENLINNLDLNDTKIQTLECTDNDLKILDNLPDTITDLDCSNNKIIDEDFNFPNLSILDCSARL